MMERFTVVNYCFGLLGVLLLQGVLNVEGRSMFNPGKFVSGLWAIEILLGCCMQPVHPLKDGRYAEPATNPQNP